MSCPESVKNCESSRKLGVPPVRAAPRRSTRRGLVGKLASEQRPRGLQVGAVVLRRETLGESGDAFAFDLAAQPEQAGRSTQLEEPGIALCGEGQRALEGGGRLILLGSPRRA